MIYMIYIQIYNYYLVCRKSFVPIDSVWLIHVVSTAPVAPDCIIYTTYYITLYFMYDIYDIYSNIIHYHIILIPYVTYLIFSTTRPITHNNSYNK